MLDEREVGLGLGGQFPIGAEAVVILMDGASGPVGGEGRVGDDGLKTQVGVLGSGMLQRVLVLQIESLVVDAVQDHVHAGEVVCGRVHLLSIEAAHVLDLLRHAQQQGAGAAGGVIDVLEAPFPGGDDLGQNGADFLRRVELARLLSRAAGELADEVFVGIAQHVGLGIGQAEVDLVKVAEHLGDEFVFLALGFPELRRAETDSSWMAASIALPFFVVSSIWSNWMPSCFRMSSAKRCIRSERYL